MDMSIDDILASVTRAHNAAAVANGLPASSANEQQEDLQALTRAWISERVAPEILPYPTDLMDRVMQRLRNQIENIEDRTSRMDAGTSFALVVIQTELERFKFLVRSFLRARIAKIDAHPQHLISVTQAVSSSSSPLLSPQELQYLHTHAALLERHYNASFLSAFPQKLRRLDDKAGAGGVGMVEGPDMDQAVFVRCLGAPLSPSQRGQTARGLDMDDDEDDRVIGADDAEEQMFRPIEVSCGHTLRAEDQNDVAGSSARNEAVERGQAGDRIVTMRRGEVWIVRWSSVKEAVAKGECELI